MAPILLLMLLAAYDVSTIIQDKMILQNATRVGIQYGLIRRPVQGDLQQVENAVQSSLPDDWMTRKAPYAPNITATLQCECSLSGATVCSSGCPSGEFRLSYLNVEVKKTSKYLFQYPGLGESINLYDKSIVRLQ
ncbi:MAG: pilus assembly protein [bacterium]|nr:pilus assembly protein [bacterium]